MADGTRRRVLERVDGSVTESEPARGGAFDRALPLLRAVREVEAAEGRAASA